MHGPVWSLIEKIDISGGSSSYHRYMLVDQCIAISGLVAVWHKRHQRLGWDMWDTANQYVSVCENSDCCPFSCSAVLVTASSTWDADPPAGKDKSGTFIWALGSACLQM